MSFVIVVCVLLDNSTLLLAGKLYLNGTSVSRIFFDSETSAGKDRLERQDIFLIIYSRYFGSLYSIPFDAFSVLSSYRLPGGGADEPGSSSKVVHAQKIEPLTLAELNEFVLSAEPQVQTDTLEVTSFLELSN